MGSLLADRNRARPLFNTIAERAVASARKLTVKLSHQISVRISSPGYTGVENLALMEINMAAS
jgi:hypothetical protein